MQNRPVWEWGVVGAIGAKLTEPDRQVLAICGDGAFQMYLQEMATACQYNLGLTWLVLNNDGLGWIRSKQKRAGAKTDTTDYKSQPDLTKSCPGLWLLCKDY